MRTSLLPTLVVLVLVGLVILLPERQEALGPVSAGPSILPGSASAGQDVAQVLAQLPELELTEPPAWALARGVDEVARNLDRLEWGGHGVLVASRHALGRESGRVTEQVLARLDDLGDADAIQIAKLITLLGDDPEPSPRVMEELVRRALSENSYVARVALKVLAYCPDDMAIGGILGRLDDDDPDLRSLARGALSERVRGGDPVARDVLLDELERTAAAPDLAYVTVLGECPPDDRGLAVLRRIANEAALSESLAALTSLLVHDDPMAVQRVEQMLATGDDTARINGLRMAAMAGRILGHDQWLPIVLGRNRSAVLALMSLLVRAIETGHDDALLAVQLLEEMAGDPTHPCQADALDALLQQQHPFAVERTRFELMRAQNPYLGVTVDRIVRADPQLAREFLPIVQSRLDDPETPPAEQVVLCRVLAHVAPELAGPRLVELAMSEDPALASAMLPYLTRIGPHAIRELAPRVENDRAAGLLIYVASVTGVPESLPLLEAIVLDTRRDQGLRRYALDAVVRLSGGPREAVLRRLAKTLGDPFVSARARLLFWNYL